MFYDCSFLSSGLGASIDRTCQLVGWLVGPRVFQFLKKFLILEKLHIFDNLLYFVMIKGVCHFKRISGNELPKKRYSGVSWPIDYTWVVWMDTYLFRIQNTEMC